MAELTLLVLHPNEHYCAEIEAAFRKYDPNIAVSHLVDLRDAPQRVRQDKPTAVVVGVDTPNDPALRTVEAISALSEDVGIIVVSREPTQELLISCMRAGSDEFLQFPIDEEELAKVMSNLLKRKGIAGAGPGKVVAVYSASGGAGVTTVACNLAAGIAESLGNGSASCILDLNLQFGCVALAMDIREFAHTVTDAVREQERLDENLLRSMMSRHSSGAAVLPAPVTIGELEEVDSARLRGVIQMCRKSYQVAVLDMPHLMDDACLVGLDEADEILILCDMLLPTIRNTIRALEILGELEHKRDKFRLIINRYYDSDQVSLDEIVEHVKLPVHWVIPYDAQLVSTSLNAGQMVYVTDPESEVAQSLIALARHTAGVAPVGRERKKRRLFKWMP